MAARRRLIVAPSAYRDLEEIWQHIAADNTVAARGQIERILLRADRLRDFPEMGIDRSLLAPSLRSVVERPYVIFDYPRIDRIEIARVFHGSRDIEAEFLSFLDEELGSTSKG